jgi:hypothetical protein
MLFSNNRINHVNIRDQQIVSKDSQNFSENTCVHGTSINQRLMTFHFLLIDSTVHNFFLKNIFYIIEPMHALQLQSLPKFPR